MSVLEDPALAGARRAQGSRRRDRQGRARGPRGVRPAELVAIGLDHTTAGIELRERLAFASAEIPAALRHLVNPAEAALEQAAILSTCNRVELYAVARARPSRREHTAWLARYHGLEPEELSGATYFHRSGKVAHHLAATPAGMRSLVLGESQILGQVRTALEHALRSGTAGPELRRLFESAIAAARRVRSETALGRGVASIPQASVEFACRHLGTLTRSTVLLIGAGNMGELAAKQLVKCRVGELLVLGRDQARAAQLAERYGGRAITSGSLSEALRRSDVIVSSAGAPRPILYRGELEPALARRGVRVSRPLLLFDLAVPRGCGSSRLRAGRRRTPHDRRSRAGRAGRVRPAPCRASRGVLDPPRRGRTLHALAGRLGDRIQLV
jgi:glutamyl-tRNA reductase